MPAVDLLKAPSKYAPPVVTCKIIAVASFLVLHTFIVKKRHLVYCSKLCQHLIKASDAPHNHVLFGQVMANFKLCGGGNALIGRCCNYLTPLPV